jgi:hypothetical protein
MNLRSKLGIFVLTAEEQRTIAFVVLALVLGLATQHYRELHSQSKPFRDAETTPASTSPSMHSKSDSQAGPDRGSDSN